MFFASPTTVKITSTLTGASNNKIVIDGVTASEDLTPEDAATQINKFLDIVEKSVSTDGMTRTVVMEAKEDNG